MVDGYQQPADQLVPVCSRPGKAAACTTDTGCPVTLGCNGRCLVTTFEDESIPCLESCVLPPATVADFHTCLLANNFCARNNFTPSDAGTVLQQYQACVQMCGVDPTCLALPANGPANCLNLDAPSRPPARAPRPTCSTAATAPCRRTASRRARSKACTCAYTTTEGSRQMLTLGGQPSPPCGR